MRNDSKHSAALSLIKTAMIEKKMTQAELADAADIHEKTIQNLLSGRSVRDQTLFDVCMVLGLDFDKVQGRVGAGRAARRATRPSPTARRAAPRPSTWAPIRAPASTTTSAATSPCARPSRSPGGIMAYRTDITWDDDWPSLLFQERDRPDKPFLHRGRLYIPASSMYIHLVSLTKGAMRMVMVSQLDPAGQMRGLVTTLSKQRAQLDAGERAHRLHQARRLRRRGAGRDRPPAMRATATTSSCSRRRSSRATRGSSPCGDGRCKAWDARRVSLQASGSALQPVAGAENPPHEREAEARNTRVMARLMPTLTSAMP